MGTIDTPATTRALSEAGDTYKLSAIAKQRLNALIPVTMHDGIILYIEQGITPSDFLTAVICNDLKGACQRADFVNIEILRNYVEWLYWHAPEPCWGSRHDMEQWQARVRFGDGGDE